MAGSLLVGQSPGDGDPDASLLESGDVRGPGYLIKRVAADAEPLQPGKGHHRLDILLIPERAVVQIW